MKKLVLALFVFAVFSLPAFAAKNENQAIAFAKSNPDVQACLQNAKASNLEVTAHATLSSDCGNEHAYTVQFAGGPKCAPNQICPMFILLVATVDVACDDTVTLETCGAGAIQ